MKTPSVAVRTAAFSLVEVVLSLALASFCLIALVGLLSVGVNNNRGAIDQTGASEVLSAAISDLYATPRTSPPGGQVSTSQFKIVIPANPVTTVPSSSITTLYFDNNGANSGTLTPTSAYRLTVTPIVATAPGTTTPSRISTFLDLKVTWPAAAPVATASGKVETFVGLNRN